MPISRTLLLADDSATIQRVIALTFADEGIDVVTVSDGDQAIRRIEASPPDIVLADVGMPNKNGYEVAKHIKRSPRLSNIPVVLLGGALDPVDEARAAEAGCDEVLVKPFEPQQAIQCVKQLLGKAIRRGELDEYFSRLDEELTSLLQVRKEPLPDPLAAASGPTQNESGIALAPPLPPAVTSAPVPGTLALDPATRAALVDEVTEEVMQRLSDHVVSGTVAEIVTRVAERLVQEEIERIKSSIK